MNIIDKWHLRWALKNGYQDKSEWESVKEVIKEEWQAGLVTALVYPDDANWDFMKVHDYCYERGFTIYPGKIATTKTFRLCALGAIDEQDIKDFYVVFEEALRHFNVQIPVKYNQFNKEKKENIKKRITSKWFRNK